MIAPVATPIPTSNPNAIVASTAFVTIVASIAAPAIVNRLPIASVQPHADPIDAHGDERTRQTRHREVHGDDRPERLPVEPEFRCHCGVQHARAIRRKGQVQDGDDPECGQQLPAIE